MKLFKLMLLAAPLLWLPTAAKAQPTNEQLVGTWYAITYPSDNETTKKLVKHMEDQTYEAISITCSGLKLSWLEKEMGTWKLDQGTLINTAETREDYNGRKHLAPSSTTTYTDVDVDDDSLSYKNANQTLLTFKPVDGYFRLGCRSMSTIN